MTEDLVRVKSDELLAFTREVFERVGVPPEDAETEAELLIWANLRGVDSHGVLRIPTYVENIEKGIMNPTPDIQIENETPATVLIEADRALGPVVTVMAMKRVIEKARVVGIGWGIIRNTTHQGAMGYYSLMAANSGMAGIASVCGGLNMAPHGARIPGIHNSPIAIAVPGKTRPPLILDMATSVAAGGKIQLAIDKGISIPEGWALDKDGNSTIDPKEYAAMLPFGGPKGSGLSIMFQCLSSLMVNNPLLEKRPGDSGRPSIQVQNSFLAAIDISTFTELESYKENVDNLIENLKGLPRADGVDEIFVPGEPEHRVFNDRMKNGIPVPKGTIDNLLIVAEKLGIEFWSGA